MTINRRNALKQFAMVAAGATLLPSCFQQADTSKPAIPLNNLKISGAQEKLLEELAETIIPATTTPGARDIGAHLFVLKMLDDCYKKEDQQKFLQGLDLFEKTSQEKFDASFVKSSKTDRSSLLSSIDGKKDLPDALSFFYSTTKRLTIQAYTSSKFYLTKVEVYKMIPGKYKGCVPVKTDITKIAS